MKQAYGLLLYISGLYLIFILSIISISFFLHAQNKNARENKKGENMNRKIMILMVAVVATVLPAVAVADVMISGSVTITGTSTTPFWFSEGPNYAAASGAGVITWTPSTGTSTSFGTVDLEGASNLSISMINVAEFHYTGSAAGNFYFNFTGDFPSGAFAVISSGPITSELTSSSSGQVPLSGTYSALLPVSGAGVWYIGFYLPPGSYSGLSFTMSVTFAQ